MIPQGVSGEGRDNSDDAVGSSGSAKPTTKRIDPFDFGVIPSTRYELHVAIRPPFELLQVVLINMLLVVAGWFLISPDAVTAAKYASLVYLPAVLASWAYSDVPSTNLYGSQPERALAAMSEPDARTKLRNLIMSRDLTLWLLVAPATAILSFVLSNVDNDFFTALMVAGCVLLLPFGALGLVSIMAPLLPYHPIPWSQRRLMRRGWPRWIIAFATPYILIAPASIVVLLPAIIVMQQWGRNNATWAAAIAITIGWTLLMRRLSVNLTLRLTIKRREWLREYLADPSRG